MELRHKGVLQHEEINPYRYSNTMDKVTPTFLSVIKEKC